MKYILIGVNIIFVFALLIRAIINGFFANTFGVEILTTILLLIGLLLAIYLSNHYVKRNAIIDKIEKTQVILIFCVVSMLTFVSVGINLNYLVALKDEGQKELPILEISPFYKSMGGIIKGEIVKPSGYYLTILYQGKKERLKFNEVEKYQDFVGQNVGLSIRKGILGFDVCIPRTLKISNNL